MQEAFHNRLSAVSLSERNFLQQAFCNSTSVMRNVDLWKQEPLNLNFFFLFSVMMIEDCRKCLNYFLLELSLPFSAMGIVNYGKPLIIYHFNFCFHFLQCGLQKPLRFLQLSFPCSAMQNEDCGKTLTFFTILHYVSTFHNGIADCWNPYIFHNFNFRFCFTQWGLQVAKTLRFF